MSEIEVDYRQRFEKLLRPLATRLEAHLRDLLKGSARVDRIAARAKSVDRFVAKANKMENGKRKYREPLVQIQDQIGARIIVFYLRDVGTIAEQVNAHLRKIESQAVVPDTESEFGYFGRHFILFLPTDLFDDSLPQALCPQFFELQIKTLFQHAWAEANHDLAYKPSGELTADHKRKIAFTAAQSWGADRIFDDLYGELNSDTA